MSNVSGSIAVNVEFRDSTTSSGVQSLKTISLRDTTEYTTGKVIYVTGTAGTAGVTLGTLANLYRNSAGNLVSSADGPWRVAFSWSGGFMGQLEDLSNSLFILRSREGRVAVTEVPEAQSGFDMSFSVPSGTGTYTVVLYGT